MAKPAADTNATTIGEVTVFKRHHRELKQALTATTTEELDPRLRSELPKDLRHETRTVANELRDDIYGSTGPSEN